MTGPPAAVAATRVAVRGWIAAADLPASVPLVVAVSGGADSLSLCAATVFECARAGRPVWSLSVDHGLQDGSAERAAAAARTALGLGAERADVRRVLVVPKDGPEADARTARYDALREYADGAWVLLGHTLDDQAETVLLGLGRGSGPRSLAGMVAMDQPWGRPLLGVRRSDTAAACVALGLSAWSDPHNADSRFTRSRLRQEVLPLLEDVLGAGVAEALARTAGQLREVESALDHYADAELSARPADRCALEVGAGFAQLPGAVRVRVVRRWLGCAGVTGLNSAQLAAIDRLVVAWRGQGPVALPRGADVVRRHDTLVLTPAAS